MQKEKYLASFKLVFFKMGLVKNAKDKKWLARLFLKWFTKEPKLDNERISEKGRLLDWEKL